MSKDGVEVVYDLYSNQEETDSRVVFYAMYAASKGYQYVRVKTRDSDPIVLTIPDPPPSILIPPHCRTSTLVYNHAARRAVIFVYSLRVNCFNLSNPSST